MTLRTRIVEAAARLLQQDGPAAVTTRAVAQAAGVQAPAIYRLFGDKDGLLDAVAEQALARYVTDKSLDGTTDDPVADLRTAWDRHIAFGLANPALYALVSDPQRAARSPVAEAGLDVLRARVHRIAAVGRLRVPERQAVELIHAAGTGAVLTLSATDPEHRDPQLPALLHDAVMRLVLTDAPSPAGDSTTAITSAAVALRAAVPDATALSAGERALMVEWLDRLVAPALA